MKRIREWREVTLPRFDEVHRSEEVSMSTRSEMNIDLATARHYYAASVPEAIAKALRLDWERDETDAESEADRMEALETMIACAIRVAVREGISNA